MAKTVDGFFRGQLHSAYATFTGELGGYLATSGTGAAHMLMGSHDAGQDALAGQLAPFGVGGRDLRHVDRHSAYHDVAGDSHDERPRT